MDGDTVKGLVYLVLIVGALAALAIGILWWKFKAVSRELVTTRAELVKTRRALADLKAQAKVKGMSDAELADSVGDLLDSL